jgi:hypothetical protein
MDEIKNILVVEQEAQAKILPDIIDHFEYLSKVYETCFFFYMQLDDKK